MSDEKAQIGFRVSHEKKQMWEMIADEYSLSLSDLIRSHMPSTVEGADVPEHVVKNSALQDVKTKMQWRHTALHLKDNIARGYGHELLQVEPADYRWVFDYLYVQYLGKAWEAFCRTEPTQTERDRYEETVKFLNSWQNDYAIVTEPDHASKSTTIDATIRCAKSIHRAEGREAGMAFAARTFDRQHIFGDDKQKIINKTRLDAMEQETGLSIDRGHNSEGGFSV